MNGWCTHRPCKRERHKQMVASGRLGKTQTRRTARKRWQTAFTYRDILHKLSK